LSTSCYEWSAAEGDAQGDRVLGSFFAYVFLGVSDVVYAVMYVLTPLTLISIFELDLTLDHTFGQGGLGVFVSGGVAMGAFILPDRSDALGGLGPTVGLGYRFESVEFSLDSTWYPDALHDTEDQRDGVVTSFSIRWRY
jgi:hypothetical protein